MEKRQKHGRSRSFTTTGGAIATFLRSTVASFSSTATATTSTSTAPYHGAARSSFNHRNAFSGPMVSIVPPEARGGRKAGGGSRGERRSGYRTPEPSSPKVSCIGQIKKSKAAGKAKKASQQHCGKNGGACPLPPRQHPAAECRRPKSSLVKRMLFRRSRSSRSGTKGRGSNAVAAAPAAPAPAGLGQMKRFTSGRAAFQDFDWRNQSDQEEEDYDEDVLVAHSAPLVLGGGVVASEPRKEVNLWSRRPMAPPTPLRLP